MSKIFSVIAPVLSAIDAAIARTILLLWKSTLDAQLRHGREPD